MRKGCKIQVFGKVQGVWFRGNTELKAKSLNLTGWVSNRSDGSVVIHAFGDPGAIKDLYQWCQTGPELARVDQVEVDDIPYEDHNEFIVRRI
ncbi:MAG: acylphosphatase [Saprospiraceae bacterium]|nr:acylphosphatase [Saprospiraceae bacterium]